MSEASGIYDMIDELERSKSWDHAKPMILEILRQLAYYTMNSEGVVSEYGETWRTEYRDTMIANASSDNREIMEGKIKESRHFGKQAARAKDLGRQKTAAHRRRDSYGELTPSLRALMDGKSMSYVE